MISVKVLYFARLREAFGRSEEELELPAGTATAGDLLNVLRARGEGWARELSERPFRLAVNQEMGDATTPLKTGDEVAIFPPVTGG